MDRRELVGSIVLAALCCVAVPGFVQAGDPADDQVPLLSEDPEITDLVLEAFLSPQAFSGRRFSYVSEGDEAEFALDSSLSATEPYAELHPERLRWPEVAGLEVKAESLALKLKPAFKEVDDDRLDRGFKVRWILASLGQRFSPLPHFAVRVVGAEVLSADSQERLFFWEAPRPPAPCSDHSEAGRPRCVLDGVDREARALAVSPDGELAALALGGIRPRLEVYRIKGEPRLSWVALFKTGSGGVLEVAFSTGGEWVVALTGRGRMHRFDAHSGGRHMGIPSAGRTARAIPPGRIMVGGESGEVKLWYLSDGTIAWRLPPRKFRGPVDRLAASGDGHRFATLAYEPERTLVSVWQVNERKILAQISADPYVVADIALDETGRALYIAHEEDGLLRAEVRNGALPIPVDSDAARLCRGRLQWTPGLDSLGCTIPGGEIRVGPDGQKKGELRAGPAASDWLVSASANGRRVVAVGGGHFLTWWND